MFPADFSDSDYHRCAAIVQQLISNAMDTVTKNSKLSNIRSAGVSCRVAKVWQPTRGSAPRIHG